MQETLLGVPVEMVSAICIAVAVLYFIYWPKPGPTQVRAAWRALVLRWFHGLTWVALALAALSLKYVNIGTAQVLGVVGLIAYLLFMAALLTDRRSAAKS